MGHLQDKVTAKIVTVLAVKLAAGEQDRIVRRETENTEAYDSFLMGWEQYQRQRPESFRQAISLLEKAAKLDPKYPRAYAALAANEAEKAAEISILEVRTFGSFGRVYLGGEERDIEVGHRAAIQAIEGVTGKVKKK